MKDLLAQHAEKFRFALVGGFNTALDFGILFGLTALGVDKIVANYASTSISFIFSFFANKTFTFKAKSGNAKREYRLYQWFGGLHRRRRGVGGRPAQADQPAGRR